MDQSYLGKTCPYCQFPIKQESEVVQCRACQVPHHRECWEENGGCTTFGCNSNSYQAVAENNLDISLDEPADRQHVGSGNSSRTIKLLTTALVIALFVIIWLVLEPVAETEIPVADSSLNDEPVEEESFSEADPFEEFYDNNEIDDPFVDRESPDNNNDEEMQGLEVVSDGDYLLALVIKETTLKPGYQPADLEAVPSYMNPSYQMYLRAEALEHLENLWNAAKEEGVTLSIRSAYRSYETQKQLFKDYASRHGEEEASRFSARPGQSEHQLGTAVDFGGTEADFTARFGETEQGRWLANNAPKYGFVKSYPQGKEHITGYIHKPWHYRYIGIDKAMEWEESGLTLKEYLKKRPQEFE